MENKILFIAEEMLKKYHLEASIELVKDTKRFSYASYNPIENKIKLYLPKIRFTFEELKKENQFKDFDFFLKFLLLHEIGHILDQDLPFLLSQKRKILSNIEHITTIHELDNLIYLLGEVILQAEMNAWDFVQEQLPNTKKGTYKTFIHSCIKGYVSSLSFFHESMAKCLPSI